jgi:hypothetical protein
MESALLYKMTIWTGPTYDEVGGKGVLTIEAYFKVALWGSRRENRNYLFSISVPFFQDWVSRHFGLYVPQGEIKVRFERERPAETEEGEIIVDFRVMTYRGKSISAQPYPREIIPLDDDGSAYDLGHVDEDSYELVSDGLEEDDGDDEDED